MKDHNRRSDTYVDLHHLCPMLANSVKIVTNLVVAKF
jgi:hypothetical protein